MVGTSVCRFLICMKEEGLGEVADGAAVGTGGPTAEICVSSGSFKPE